MCSATETKKKFLEVYDASVTLASIPRTSFPELFLNTSNGNYFSERNVTEKM